MDLSYSDEQRLLKDSADGLLASRAQTKGANELWAEMAELGWLALPIPESYGGFAQGAVDVAILGESFGRHLVSTPYVSCVTLCGSLVASLGTDEQKRAMLSALVAGEARLALAHAEDGARNQLPHVATRATRDGAGWRLSGRKIAVLDGGEAKTLIVSARIAGATRDEAGIGLFLVEPGHSGVTVEAYPKLDGGFAARVALDEATLPADALLGRTENAFSELQRAFDRATAVWCSELVGLMEAATAATIDYTKMRVQFGRPLAANQVLRHRMADMSILCEEARSMALRAALHVDSDNPAEAARAVSGAWAKISRAARFVAEQAIQLHGGMGVTNELRIGGYLKRVVALDAIVGGPDHHLRRHAALSHRSAPAA
jgi:alkylation response protein AidB-like acyl-CoA dehydrogenase